MDEVLDEDWSGGGASIHSAGTGRGCKARLTVSGSVCGLDERTPIERKESGFGSRLLF